MVGLPKPAAALIGLVYEGIRPISLLSRPVAVMVICGCMYDHWNSMGVCIMWE